MSEENLKLWNQVCKTDPSKTKNMTVGGRKVTTIDAQTRFKNATSMFGPYGIGWGVLPESEEFLYKTLGTTELVVYKATLFYDYEGKRGLVPITDTIQLAYITDKGNGYLKVDDEAGKKAVTSAVTKGLSRIGFDSDVYEGLFEDDKYVQQVTQEFYYLSVVEVDALEKLITEAKADKPKFLQFMKVESLQAIPKHDFQKAVASLDAKKGRYNDSSIRRRTRK